MHLIAVCVLLVSAVTIAQARSRPIESPCVCTQEYLPVCGSDGVEYSNKCVARCSRIYRVLPGPCEDFSEPNQSNDCVCNRMWAPVCGVDGKTYGNKCMARCYGIYRGVSGVCEDREDLQAELVPVLPEDNPRAEQLPVFPDGPELYPSKKQVASQLPANIDDLKPDQLPVFPEDNPIAEQLPVFPEDNPVAEQLPVFPEGPELYPAIRKRAKSSH